MTSAAGESVGSIYRGVYFYNFETAYLTPEDSTECWATKGNMSAAEIPNPKRQPSSGTADVVVRGTLSSVGHYGKLGACTRLLTVLDVIEARNMVSK